MQKRVLNLKKESINYNKIYSERPTLNDVFLELTGKELRDQMFIHNFKYAFKTLFKNRMLIFWTFAFPIILGTLFNMAFSNIENSEKLDIINIAIINNDDFE